MKFFRFAAPRPTWRALACAASALALPLSAPAAPEDGADARPVVITGTVLPRTLGGEIAATSVLTRADIERAGARDLISALNLLGTAQVEQQGGPGSLASVRLRGADSRDTLVLVDGVPLTDVTSGQASLAQIAADTIERIEVVRGNLSALYGANATGGVIQVFTRRGAKGSSAQVQAGLGSRNTRWSSASLARGSEAVQARLSFGVEHTDGFSAGNPAIAPQANPDDDGNTRRHVALALDATPMGGHRLGLDVHALSGTVDHDDVSIYGSPSDMHRSHTMQRGLTLRGNHTLDGMWSLNWRTGRGDELRTDAGTSTFGPFESRNTLHNRMAAVDATGSLTDRWTLQVGGERLSQSTDSAAYTRNSRDTDTLRLGATYDAPWGSLQGNARRDRISDTGTVNTGLLGGSLRLGRGFSLIASVSTSFTPPTLDFLFYDCSPYPACSNPDLKPERARNTDLGLQWERGPALVRATLFDVRYRDKIINDPALVPSFVYMPKNLANARNTGLELSAHTRAGRWRVSGEAVFQDPVNADNGARLDRRAREQASLQGSYDAGAWSLTTGLRYVGDRMDGMAKLPSYVVTDLSARWTLAPQWTLQATVDNLFARDYQPVYGYNGRPRGLFVSLGWQTAP